MTRAGLTSAAAAIAAAMLAVTPSPDAAAGDPGAAAERYRVARRLAAEGSPQAEAALQQVVELDPDGPLADDALLDMARLLGAAQWPEELGRVSPAAAPRILALLERVNEGFSDGDRAEEARLTLALALLQPQGGGDPRRARVELLGLATDPEAGAWSLRARYVIAWLDAREGRAERAVSAYQRLFLDGEGDAVVPRAAAGAGRSFLRLGAFRAAAIWSQRAVDRGAPPDNRAVALRELAVRGMLVRASSPRGWTAGQTGRMATGMRSPEWLVRLPDGDRLVADRKADTVVRYRTQGTAVESWTLKDLQAVAVGPLGRPFAAAGAEIYLLAGESPVPVASQGDFSPVSGMALDGEGGIWLVDRKGERVGRIPPDASSPTILWDDKSARLSALGWDGVRIVALDARTGALLVLTRDGLARPHGSAVFHKPVAMSVLPLGVLAVLDERQEQIVILGSEGQIESTVPVPRLGVAKPRSIALAWDGSLDVLDGNGGAVVAAP